MTIDDEKLAFFSRHWEVIADWTSLLRAAAEDLDSQLLAGLHWSGEDSETPTPEVTTGGRRLAQLHTGPEREAYVELSWTTSQLIEQHWPTLAVVWDKGRGDLKVRAAVKAATRDHCVQQGLTTPGNGTSWFVWSAELRPGGGPLDIDDYARSVVDRFRTAWTTMHGPIQEAIASA